MKHLYNTSCQQQIDKIGYHARVTLVNKICISQKKTELALRNVIALFLIASHKTKFCKASQLLTVKNHLFHLSQILLSQMHYEIFI